MADTLLPVRGIENLKPAGRRAVVDIANNLGINPDWLVTVMSFESAGSFDPAKKNAAGSGAVGLIQFMPSTATRLGTTTAQLALMSQEEQIRTAVWHYFQGFKGRMKSLDDVYLAVFFPSAMGQADDYIVGDKNGTSFQQAVYNQNAGFDKAGTGYIRRGDIVSTIRSVAAAAQGKPRVDVPAAGLWRLPIYLAATGLAAYGIIRWGYARG